MLRETYFNPLHLLKVVISNRELLWQFTRRELINKYKGSYLGFFWSFITPLLMLGIYTFVFSVIFKAKWDFAVTDSKQEFAITLFCGMLIFGIFSECITRSSGLIVINSNYVKKVVFPLQILPVSLLIGALINFLVGVCILLAGQMIFFHEVPVTVIYLPIVIIPLIFSSLGLSYILSSLGVFLRDLEHSVSIIVQALYFLTPIFYPISAVPVELKPYLYANPLTGFVEDARRVVVWGLQPDWRIWCIYLAASLLILQLGYWWFMKTRKGFADVL
ncbi:Teichoic acid translocation permease protein TagG [Pelotomaculum sp. FP]|uniref:ABC transporter permease n=1 Tax=Pelotomaculum sp. FP TaxID=261474 RepID=UPI0010670CA6|nr:ABC transporter permease [Pelotomaculum sp. FP]TEB16176.1 Teichoic acid translocation permease protein TagG [Pelotomaculum sp. FP]